MRRSIIILIFILAFIAILLLLDLPLYNKITSLREEIKKYEEFLKEKEEILVKVNQLKQVYDSRKSEMNRVFYVLPIEKDLPNLIVQFEALASENGLILEKINFIKQQTTTRRVAAEDAELGAAETLEPQKDYKTLEVSLSLSGNYQSFQSFLEALELNIRLMDIKSISFKTQKTEAGAGFTFDINLQVYYQ